MSYLSAKDLAILEERLGISLPPHYKDFNLHQHPLIDRLREHGENDDTLTLITDLDFLLEISGFFEIPKSEGPCRNKFVIGQDGCGNFYLIDLLDHENTKVYFLDHDSYEEEEVFDVEKNDYKWEEHPGLSVGSSIPDFVEKETARAIAYKQRK